MAAGRFARRPSPSSVAGVVLSLLAVPVLAGCGEGTVEVDAYDLTAAAREPCEALVEALPDRVSDQDRREVSGSPYAAAYGDPPIVVRCGVGEPDGFDKFSACNRANGIDWFVADLEEAVEDQSLDIRMTTIGRSPRLRVDIPAEYRPPVTAMVDLTGTIKAHTEKTGGCLD